MEPLRRSCLEPARNRKTFWPPHYGPFRGSRVPKTTCLHFFTWLLHAVMRSQFRTRSVWLNLELVATSIICHPHTAVTRACNIICGWGFGLGGGTMNHSTSPVSLFYCLSVFVCLSQLRDIRIHTYILTCSQARSDIPLKTTAITIYPPHPNSPSQTDLCMHKRKQSRTHIVKTLFIWRNWKKAFLIYSPSCSAVEETLYVSMCACIWGRS